MPTTTAPEAVGQLPNGLASCNDDDDNNNDDDDRGGGLAPSRFAVIL